MKRLRSIRRTPRPHAGSSGRRERKRAETRWALLEAALSCVATHGIFDTRVEDITERADISKGAFYNYFPSKHDLAAARLQDALAKRRLPRTSEAHARTVVRAHLELFAETPVLALVLHQARAVQYLTTTTAHAGGDDAVSHSPRIAGRLPRPSPEAGHRRPGVRVHSTHQK